MWSAAPSVVKSMSRYARRLSSVDSIPIESNRFLIVPVLSSAARMPFPGATSARAVSFRSAIVALLNSRWWPALSPILHRAILGRHADVAQLVEHQLPKLRVAGSNPVVRSIESPAQAGFSRF